MEQEIDSLFDVKKLSKSSQRKYKHFFQLQLKEGQILSEAITDHFNNKFKIENVQDEIDDYLSLKKDDIVTDTHVQRQISAFWENSNFQKIVEDKNKQVQSEGN